ncbi:N-acetylmuramyl-L-alanine amidase, negative regulator of AmpC, AmpD [Polynucleobacter meluiroseus]|uniref:1,6-anhydro-N-acetylmuramyl-L-alanine amidase AmpD n=1 Tax=Polynucleobacter meluiroseus TaxID=1938814 RepID=A0A240E0M8_9BURK|nr:N-acetylmuramyl-L-alanine amidase, negative regulator of AmpC, AmpD [Polynucleobacter meluiroseus]
MIKWLFLIVGAFLFYYWLQGKKRVSQKAATAQVKKKSAQIVRSEPMVQCQACQLHLPQSAAITSENRFYCSEEHLHGLDKQGWLGSAQWRVSPNQDQRPTSEVPDLVVLHHISLPAGGFQNEDCTHWIVDFFLNQLNPNAHPYFKEIGGQRVSSHFLISRKGQIIQFVSTQNKAWHAGASSFFGREKCNDFSIGIELEGDSDHPFEEVQYQSLLHLNNALRTLNPHFQFAGHSDIAPNRKTDPGIQFNWSKFQAESGNPANDFPYGLNSR